uniref:Uncharacterized protein n=1 Tax=Aegilops tauschii TaxID=37682 RepID=M8BWG8_AEGTA
MELVDPGGDEMITGFVKLLHLHDSQTEGIANPESSCGIDMLASIAAARRSGFGANLQLWMVAHPIRFGATRKQPMYPSPDMARRILLHGSHPEVGKLETQVPRNVHSGIVPL